MTLVEFAIALALSIAVLSAVGYAYVDQRASQRRHEDLALIQGAARLALEEIGRDIRQAGHIGCNSALQRHVDKRVTEAVVVPVYGAIVPTGADNFTIDARNALRVFDSDAAASVWGGARPADAAPGTNVIEVRYANGDGATRLSGPIPAAGNEAPTMGQFEPSRGDMIPELTNRLALISDCQNAMVVSVSNAEPTRITLPPGLPIDFTRCGHASRIGAGCFHWPSTVVMPIRVVQYYVADVGTPARPDRRLMSRKRLMSPGAIVWNTPQTVAQGIRDLRATGAGLDAAWPQDIQWRAVRWVDELVNGANPVAALVPDEWPRVIRLDLRLSMQANRVTAATERPVIRNFEASYTVRARVSLDPS